jgi:hypothetical protein
MHQQTVISSRSLRQRAAPCEGSGGICDDLLLESGPWISLEPVVQGPITETVKAARAGMKDTAKLVAERFECQTEDA